MADLLDANEAAGAPFGGAFLIIPPGDDAEVVDGLTLTTGRNPVVFWSNVSGQVDLAVARLKDGQEQRRGYR
jgi:hypothetical protein